MLTFKDNKKNKTDVVVKEWKKEDNVNKIDVQDITTVKTTVLHVKKHQLHKTQKNLNN